MSFEENCCDMEHRETERSHCYPSGWYANVKQQNSHEGMFASYIRLAHFRRRLTCNWIEYFAQCFGDGAGIRGDDLEVLLNNFSLFDFSLYKQSILCERDMSFEKAEVLFKNIQSAGSF